MRGLFVTGTDTGVGKSVVSAALLASMRAVGVKAGAYKPVLTGTGEAPDGGWPPDDALLGLAAGSDPASIAPLRFEPAVSPHLAAELAGRAIEPAALLDWARRLAPGPHDTLIVEGVGGLLVPLADDYLVLDLARALALALVIVARPSLGTINHSLLSIRAARAAGLRVAAVVLTPWPAQPSELELSNRDTIARLGDLDVEILPTLAAPDLDLLAQAGESLPWRDWLT